MPETESNTARTPEGEGEARDNSLIDPVYRSFVKGVMRAVGSTEFYEFFMDALSKAQNEFQFSNRKLLKTVDTTWIDAIEDALKPMERIIASPRNIIKEEELVVNVATARKAGAETVRHLAMHSGLVEKFDEARGEVQPAKLMQRFREDSFGMYENRLVYTTLEYAHHFVRARYEALFEAMNDEFGAKLKVASEMETAVEHVHFDMFLHIKEIDSPLETDEKNRESFERISRIYRVLTAYMATPFAQQLSQLPKMKGNITMTNVLKRNPDYHAVVTLYQFLKKYDDVGYAIQVIEQKPDISADFQRDIFHNIMFNYLVLKGYLEDEQDRKLPGKVSGRKRTLKPKMIRQIIEELTEDYDLPDVEVRKVLVEELTKADLMQEEAAERRRLVEEAEQRRKEEAKRLEEERKAEAKRIQEEKRAEQERLRLEKEAQEEKKRQALLAQKIEDRRRGRLLEAELKNFHDNWQARLERRKREEAAQKKTESVEEVARATEEKKRQEKAARVEERKRRQEERLRAEQEAEEARLREEAEARRALEQQMEADQRAAAPYRREADRFAAALEQRMALRGAERESEDSGGET